MDRLAHRFTVPPIDTMIRCHHCQHLFQGACEEASTLPRVTSDCRPATVACDLAVCPGCCLVQTVVGASWQQASEAAYAQYDIYAAAGGAEQQVASDNGLRMRSEVLAARLAEMNLLPQAGRLIDLGCGNGAFLRAFSRWFPGWQLEGAETDARHAATLAAIPRFETLHGVDIASLPPGYAAAAMVHVLEHLDDPRSRLAQLRKKVSPGGFLFVEVPCWRKNPFALMISDHASHFTRETLARVVHGAGWDVATSSPDWVPKEISLVATNSAPRAPDVMAPNYQAEHQALLSAVRWLAQTMEHARNVAASSPSLGLFGSAIAATWLFQGMPDKVRFWVDEDPNRIGRSHLGLPIIAPDQVPRGSDVFVGVSPILAHVIQERLRNGRFGVHVPGPIEA